jgi:8-oxo-dGTP diphosphatase
MICQRPAHKARGLLWEFVGGKTEPGETGEEALIRECREELDVTVAPKDIFMEVVHEYPDITVHLKLYNAVIAQGIPQKLERLPVLVQANAEFFLNRATAGMALRMLKRGQIHLLGSDCHNLSARKPNLGPALHKICQKLGQESLQRIEYYERDLLDA